MEWMMFMYCIRDLSMMHHEFTLYLHVLTYLLTVQQRLGTLSVMEYKSVPVWHGVWLWCESFWLLLGRWVD